MNDDDEYELEVTVTFAVPLTSGLVLDPHQMATHMRERWINDDSELTEIVADAISSDFDLQVKPVFIS